MIPLLISSLFVGCLGLLMEVLYTGLYSLFYHPWGTGGKGHVSLIMMPLYIVIVPTLQKLHHSVHFYDNVFVNAFLMAALLYTPLIFGFELLYGLLLKKIKIKAWDYSDKDMNFMGLITLSLAPAWLFVSFIFELSVSFWPLIQGFLINTLRAFS